MDSEEVERHADGESGGMGLQTVIPRRYQEGRGRQSQMLQRAHDMNKENQAPRFSNRGKK